MLIALGVGLAVASGAWLTWLTLRPGAPARFPVYGWCGVVAMAGLELLLALRSPLVTTFFTALIWTAYVLTIDGAVYRRKRDSWLHHPRALAAMAVLSVPGWMVFEVYNLRLKNWVYVGVPRDFWVFAIGATWAFATIYPGIFETAELIEAALTERWRCRPWKVGAGGGWIAAGVVCLAGPLMAPTRWAPYLFAPVWAGFVFLLEPINRKLGWPSLLGDLEQGRAGQIAALLLSGLACGFFWEFWNYWAQARWWYVFPILPRARIFAMPAPGFLGFPPFALECFTMYVFLAGWLLPRRWTTNACGSLNRKEASTAPCQDAPI